MSKNSNKNDSVKHNRPPLVISTEEEFIALMERIDRELIDEGINIQRRTLMAGLKLTKQYDIELLYAPLSGDIVPNVFTPEQISLKLRTWMERRYGDKQKIDFTLGRIVHPLRGSLFTIRCPTVFGTVNYNCDPKTFGNPKSNIAVGSPLRGNMLDLIDGLTVGLAQSLTAEEIVKIGCSFFTVTNTYMALRAIREAAYVNEALGDLEASVTHLMSQAQQLGQSKWSSLQAAEKLIKAVIVAGGAKTRKNHRLKDQICDAAKFGFPPPPDKYVKGLQCTAGVRYGDESVTEKEAVLAHHISLEMCEVASQCIGKIKRISVPKNPEPKIDGVPMYEFLQKNFR